MLEQEKYALEQIKEVNKEKEDLLKKAKEGAKKELASYDEEKREQNMSKITDLASNTEIIDEIFEKREIDLAKIDESYNANKDKVIEFLFNNVIKVEFGVPDVVKGNFEEKFGVKEE